MTALKGWRDVVLGDLEKESCGIIQTGPFGSQLHMSDYSETGTPVVMPTNIRDLRISTNGIARVSQEHVGRLARHRLRAGDIVYSRRGDVEKCALITDEQAGWLCGTGCLLVRVGGPRVDTRCLAYVLSLPQTRTWISQHAVGATMLNLNTELLREVPVTLPPIEEQRGIAATLGALDDKIESNQRAGAILRQIGKAETHAHVGGRRSMLNGLALSISRGVTPKYADSDLTAPLVLNQRCIRDNWISSEAARHMHDRGTADAKRVNSGDILVNSTGTGTLGRVGRWHQGSIFADSHISIVKPDASRIGPTVLAYLLFDREGDIEDMATGSTGQTELSPSRLGQLELALPSAEDIERLEPMLDALENRAASLQSENNHLAAVRDALLPEFLYGRLRVPEAREAVHEVVV